MTWTAKPPSGTGLASTSLTTGLVAVIPFNEGTGNPYEIINNAAATSYGSPTWTTLSSPDNYGMVYSAACSVIPHTSAMDTDNVTVTVRFNLTSGVTGAAELIDKWPDLSGAGYQYGLQCITSGTLSMRAYDGTHAPSIASTTLSSSTWYTLSGTRTKGGNLSVYLDGSFVDSASDTATDSLTNDLPFSIAARNSDGTLSNTLDVTVSLVLIHNYELNSTQIASLHSNPWQIFETSSVPTTTSASIMMDF